MYRRIAKFKKDPYQTTMTQHVRRAKRKTREEELTARLKAKEEKKGARNQGKVPTTIWIDPDADEVELLRIITPNGNEPKKIKAEANPTDETQDETQPEKRNIQDMLDQMEEEEAKEDKKPAAKTQEVREEEEEEQVQEEDEDSYKYTGNDYTDTIESREFKVRVLWNDPLQEPIPGYNKHFFEPEFVVTYNKNILRTVNAYVDKKEKLLDDFMGNSGFPEWSDGPQREFLENVTLVKDSILDMTFPIGLLDKRFIPMYIKGGLVRLNDELIDFFYHIIKARSFIFKFKIDEDKYNYELTTIWPESDDKQHSYGKTKLEDLSFLL